MDHEPDQYRTGIDEEEIHTNQTGTHPDRSSTIEIDGDEATESQFEIRLRASHGQDGGKNSILSRVTSTGTMKGTTERVYFSGPYQQTDIDLDAIQAVDHRRDRGHMALYAVAAILGLLGIMRLTADPAGSILVLIFAFIIGYIAFNIRGETLRIVTGGKTFTYRALTAQDSRKVGKYIRQLKRKRETIDEMSQQSLDND